MEIIHYVIICTDEDALSKLFRTDDDGRLRFGVTSRSKKKVSIAELFHGELEFIGYVMEGFIHYFIAVQATETGLQLSIRKTRDNKERDLDFLIELEARSLGYTVSRVAV